MEETTATTERQPFLSEGWFDLLEAAVRGRIRGFIEEMLEAELNAALQRGRYDRHGTTRGHRHGHRARQLVGTFGPVTLSVPRARLAGADGRTSEWRNQTIPAYGRLTKRAEALIDVLGYGEFRHQAAGTLSGGTRQKLSLTLALLHQPAVLLLDEPYQGFDWETYLAFWKLAGELRAAGTATLVITHLVFEQERFDRVWQLAAGRIAETEAGHAPAA